MLSAARVALGGLVLAGTACSSPGVTVEFLFPDPTTRAEASVLRVNVIEPFTTNNAEGTRTFLRCNEVGVFSPTSKVGRSGSALSGVQLLTDQAEENLPLDGDWSLPIDKVVATEDANPWRAIMVLVEAAGTVSRFDNNAVVQEGEKKTLVQGCFCVRLSEDGRSGNRALDEEVLAACPALSETPERQVPLLAVAPPEFVLETCGVPELTAPRGQRLHATPGVCLNTVRCDQQASGQPCFRCASDLCKELDNQSGVPIRFSVQQPQGTAGPVAPLILTSPQGMAVADVQIDDCVTPPTLIAEIVGRPESRLEFPVTCVDPVAFDGAPSATTLIGGGGSIAGITRFGDAGRPMMALLTSAAAGATIRVYQAGAGGLSEVHALNLPNEKGLGIHGYHYRLGPPAEVPLLAVVTAVGTPSRPHVQLFRWNNGLERVSEISDICAYSTCDQRGQMCQGMGPPCALNLGQVTSVNLSDADVNGDNLADLSYATDRDFPLTLFLSRSDAPDLPPPLDQSCQCTTFGRSLPTYELIHLGGPSESLVRANADLVMGDGTGAYVGYANGGNLVGPPCSLTSTAGPSCSAGLTCTEICPGRARCLRTCSDDSSCTAPLSPSCIKDTGMSSGFCGGPALACRQPLSVWRLITIHDVGKGSIRGERLQDAIAVGAGTPVQGFSGTGFVRAMFGAELDLSTIDDQPREIRKLASVDLTPRATMPNVNAQGPRSVEVGDFNADGKDDLAVLYGGSEEIRVWLGGHNKNPGEIETRIRLNDCTDACAPSQRCLPHPKFVAADLDGDGYHELAAACVPEDGQPPTLKWFKPNVP